MSDEKHLPASGKRRNELRQKGQVVKSQDVSSTAMLTVGLFGLLIFGSFIARGMAEIMISCFREMEKASAFRNAMGPIYIVLHSNLVLYLGLFFFIICLVAVANQLLQVGVLFTTKPLEWDVNKLNPVNGLKKLFSLRKLVSLFTSLIKLIVVLGFMYSAVKTLLTDPVFIRVVNVQEIGKFMIRVSWEIGWRVIWALAVIALVDYLYQRWQYERDNRMSTAEYKDEYKQTEGSPEVKKKIKSAMRKQSLRRMMEDMADATVVITNPTHYAVALRYIRGKTLTPMVVAKGIRLIALKIRKRAEELGIPTMENRSLAQGLYKYSQVGEPIPVMFYHAVALLLAELYKRGFQHPEDTDEEPTEEGETPESEMI